MNECITYNELATLLGVYPMLYWTDSANAIWEDGKITDVKPTAMLRNYMSYSRDCRDRKVENIIVHSFNGWSLPTREWLSQFASVPIVSVGDIGKEKGL